jgi:hypothetical protein
MTVGAIIVIIATVLIIAVVAYAARREYDKHRTRASFGPEYARVKAEHGGTRAADRELARRSRMHDELRLEPISADDRDFYATSWGHIQGGFLDDPRVALSGAEQLIARLLAARGYRSALMHYHALFGDLLTPPGAATPRAIQEMEVTP